MNDIPEIEAAMIIAAATIASTNCKDKDGALETARAFREAFHAVKLGHKSYYELQKASAA